MRTCKLKATKQLVYVINSGERYAECLIPFDRVSRKGNRGDYCLIRKEKLIEEKQYGYG